MAFELFAVIVSGFAGAGVMMLIMKLTGGPRWMVPLAAGAAMLGVTVSSEYGWYGRTVANLPEGMVVADSVSRPVWWRPWTYAVPMTERFIALDTANLRANEATEGLYLADLYFFGRWRAVQSLQVMVDCPGGRRAEPLRGDGGRPVWREVGADDVIVSAVCTRV